MTLTMTRNFAQGLAIGDYAAKRNMHRSFARRAKGRGLADQRREQTERALRYRAVINAIQRGFPALVNEPGVYFYVD